MATNREHAPTNTLELVGTDLAAPNTPPNSGDPVEFGAANVPGVALTDQNADGNVTVEFGQHFVVYNLAVTGANDVGNTAIAVGDIVQYDGGTLNADAANGSDYGIALDAVDSGATTTIRVAVGLGL